MGQDYLYLEAVRGVSVGAVGDAITHALTKDGWEVVEPGAAREIRIATRGDWVVITDREGKESPGVWAKTLSKALRAKAISARSWSDYGQIEIRRFDVGKLRGELTASFEDEIAGAFDLGFLADLAASKARPKLAQLKPGKAGPDEVVERILKLAGLPPAFDRYMELEADLRLGFYRPAARSFDVPFFAGALGASVVLLERGDIEVGAALTEPEVTPVSPARPVKRAKKVFGRTYHVRAQRADVVRAMRDELAAHLIRPRRASNEDVEREIFLRETGGICSIGEKLYRRRSVSWGEVLSKRLRVPVLVADADATFGFSLTACCDGVEGVSVDFPNCIDDERRTADVRPLAAFALPSAKALDLRRVPLGKNDVFVPAAAIARVAKSFGIDDPLFAKAFDGIALAFT